MIRTIGSFTEWLVIFIVIRVKKVIKKLTMGNFVTLVIYIKCFCTGTTCVLCVYIIFLIPIE